MGIVRNTTKEDQYIQVFGNHFHFKPKQIKIMDEDKVHFIVSKLSYKGFVELPQAFEDPGYQRSEEGKQVLEERDKEGIKSYLSHQRMLVKNCTESLQQDYWNKNIKADPKGSMSEGEMKALELLAKYAASNEDEEKKRAEKADELLKKLEKNGNL